MCTTKPIHECWHGLFNCLNHFLRNVKDALRMGKDPLKTESEKWKELEKVSKAVEIWIQADVVQVTEQTE